MPWAVEKLVRTQSVDEQENSITIHSDWERLADGIESEYDAREWAGDYSERTIGIRLVLGGIEHNPWMKLRVVET